MVFYYSITIPFPSAKSSWGSSVVSPSMFDSMLLWFFVSLALSVDSEVSFRNFPTSFAEGVTDTVK